MRMIFLVYYIASLFHYVFLVSVLSPGPIRDIFPTFMARYNLFVLKVPLNPKQTMRHGCAEVDTVTVTVGKYAPCILHTFPYATIDRQIMPWLHLLFDFDSTAVRLMLIRGHQGHSDVTHYRRSKTDLFAYYAPPQGRLLRINDRANAPWKK